MNEQLVASDSGLRWQAPRDTALARATRPVAQTDQGRVRRTARAAMGESLQFLAELLADSARAERRALPFHVTPIFSATSPQDVPIQTSWTRLRLLLGLGLAMLLASCAATGERPTDHTQTVQTVILRGRVVCLAEELHRLHDAELPTNHQHLWALQASDGRLYTLLRSHFSEAIWLDERIRARELELKARLFPGTQALEVQRLRSVVRGVVQDLYYYCDICDIQSVTPEQCACCQGPVKLVERPLSGRTD